MNRIKRNTKKAVSNIIVAVLLIVLVITLIAIFWASVIKIIRMSPLETEYIDLTNQISIEKACYLNENEIKIDIKRSFGEVDIEKLRVYFLGDSENIFEISGKKCSDIKINEKYGGYCEVLRAGESLSYIFNMTGLTKKQKVELEVFIKGEKEGRSVNKINIDEIC